MQTDIRKIESAEDLFDASREHLEAEFAGLAAATRPTRSQGLAVALVAVLESGRGAGEVLAADCFCDINVPALRLQMQGPEAFVAWWHEEVQGNGRVTVGRSASTASGFVLETEIEFPHGDQALYARQIFLCEVDNDRISELVLYCTGDWDEQTRAHQRAHAPMIRS